MKVGFIGLGSMGAPMALNLVKAGHDVRGFDVVSSALADYTQAGGKIVDSIADAVKEANIVITMLPGDAQVESVYRDKNGIMASAQPGTLFIDCSTISPGVASALCREAQTRSSNLLDAPVSGGTSGAQAGTLTFIIGGDLASLDTARPVLESMGKRIFHAGPSGAGQTVKICNNMLLGALTLGTSEAMRLGVNNGLDPKTLTDIMCQSTGQNCVLETYNPCPGVMDNVPSARGYHGGFMTDLMIKDLELAAALASSSQVDTPVADLVRQLYKIHRSKDDSHGRLDHTSVYNLSIPSSQVLAEVSTEK